jgi:hypothetical protein
MAAPLDTEDPRWQLTLRVLGSPLFQKSPRLRAFLKFICEMELTGRRLGINEQQIGVNVFGRPEAYNPGEDSIVRSQARFLRQRLDDYFRTSGQHEPFRILIPKGSYVPTFEAIPEIVTEPYTAAEPALPLVAQPILPAEAKLIVPPPSLAGVVSQRITIALVMLVLLSLTGFLLFRRAARQFETPEARFWNTLFDPKRRQVIVPADSTLILIEELTGQQVSLQSYLSRDYLDKMQLPAGFTAFSNSDLRVSHYTSMADLNLVAGIVRVPHVRQMRAEIRYARDLSISDAKEDNLVLIGGARANPWIELFSSHMNFYVDYDWKTRQNVVINKAPQPGEAPLYVESSSDSAHGVYGLIAFQPSLDGEGDALLVAGTSAAGTQSAEDFLLSDRSFGELLRRIQRPDGSIPHFELLLEARSLGGNVPQSRIVAFRPTPEKS